MIEQKTSWNDGVDDGRGLRIVILKNVFDPKEALSDPNYYEVCVETSIYRSSDLLCGKDIRVDMLEECSKLGEIEKV